MTATEKPFLDQEAPPDIPPELRHMYPLPRACWTYSRTGEPESMDRVTGIVFHKISGRYAFPDDPFNPQMIDEKILVPSRYSYNLMIYRNALAVRRVPEPYKAFHAGKSIFDGEKYCNGFMIGISIVSKGYADKHGDAFEPAQIDKLIDVCAHLIEEYDFDQRRITSHEHVREVWNREYPNKPGQSRTGDPGKFPWTSFRDRLRERLA